MPTHNLCFEQEYEEIRIFYLKIFIFRGKIFSIFEQACFLKIQMMKEKMFALHL